MKEKDARNKKEWQEKIDRSIDRANTLDNEKPITSEMAIRNTSIKSIDRDENITNSASP